MKFRQFDFSAYAVVAAVGLILFATQFAGPDAKAQPQKGEGPACSVVISRPLPGTKVGERSAVSGTAKIPANTHLWILAHKKTLNGWWPQGGGETLIDEDGSWAVDVQYGVDTDKGDFEVAAVVVDSAGNNAFNLWVDTAAKTGTYPSIRFQTVVDGCAVAKVTVNKQ
jgi:hypothetical protein